MKKIQSLFKRDYEGTRQVYDEVVEGSEWVLNGEGVATVKWDGTACMIEDNVLYKRYDVKKGRSVPDGAIACEEKANQHTGHWPHWVKVGDGPEDKYHRDGFENSYGGSVALPDGTYELIGPKVNGNKHQGDVRVLKSHGSVTITRMSTNFDEIKIFLSNNHDYPFEGIVWHHPDGRMVKIKKKDFGLKW